MEKDLEIKLMTKIRLTENMIKRSASVHHAGHKGNGRILTAVRDNNGITQTQLADELDIRPQSLTRALAELEEMGYIERKRDENDRRNISVFITEEGRSLCKKIHEARKARAKNIFGCLSAEEQETLSTLLETVLSNGEEKC